MYSKTLLDHFQNPRNAGELHEANAIVEVTNPICGDVLKLSARMENARIRDIRFLCRGCTPAIACASLLTGLIADKSRAETNGITAERLSQMLGGLPAASFHAADLAIEALSQLYRHARGV